MIDLVRIKCSAVLNIRIQWGHVVFNSKKGKQIILTSSINENCKDPQRKVAKIFRDLLKLVWEFLKSYFSLGS